MRKSDRGSGPRDVARRTLFEAAAALAGVLILEVLGGAPADDRVRLVSVVWWLACAGMGWLAIPLGLRAAFELFDDAEVDEFLASSRWLVLLWSVFLAQRSPDGWGYFFGAVAAGLLVYVTRLAREYFDIESRGESAAARARWSDGWRSKRVHGE